MTRIPSMIPLSRSAREYNKMVDETFEEIKRLSEQKGGEYAGDGDRLENFKRNGRALDLPMESVWAVYAAKHWDAIIQWIKDIGRDTTRVRAEPLEGRIDDLIVYLLLLKYRMRERNEIAGDTTAEWE